MSKPIHLTEAEWLHMGEPRRMLRFLRGRISDRKRRLFAVACCRRIRHLLDKQSLDALDVAERFADRRASRREMARARRLAGRVEEKLYWEQGRAEARAWFGNTAE
jgi:hypothetical protein